MSSATWPSLDRTRAAMAAYDHAVAALMGCEPHLADECLTATARAWDAVAAAFATDTEKFNRRDVVLGAARAPFFEPFMRGLLRGVQ